MAVGLEPRTSRSGVRHSTTEPPRSLLYRVDKMKENNQHNNILLNEHKMMQNLYSTISTNAFMDTLKSNIKSQGETLLELTLNIKQT